MQLSFSRPDHRPPPLAFDASNQHRDLQDNNDNFVDADGNSYNAYSVAWRYLGLFIDCNSGNNNNNGNDDPSTYCTRKVLWAAYHDPGYKGGSIGEYSFYDRHSDKWNAKTCRAQRWWPFTRCQKLNCHEASTNFELIGVFKETDGLVDWTEQLFKHSGYCLWGEDAQDEGGSGDSQDGNEASSDYNFMETVRQSLITSCTYLNGYTDKNGNAVYVDTKPLSGGDMTYGLYIDAYCMTEASGVTYSDYLKTSGADDDDGNEGSSFMSSLNRWNDLLSDYKVCQPCRAYSRIRSNQGGSHDSGDQSGSRDDEEEEWGEDDGEGNNEQWGFDCNDDAGYLNCNQCYKFESQTDMEAASTADLEAATKQGTILAVRLADGTKYGKGQYRAPGYAGRVLKKTALWFSFSVLLIGVVFTYFLFYLRKRRRAVNNAELKDGLTVVTEAPLDEEDWFGGKFNTFVYGNTATDGNDQVRNNGTDFHNAAVEEVRDKAALLALLKQRDVKLSQQEELIEQLKHQLESYKER